MSATEPPQPILGVEPEGRRKRSKMKIALVSLFLLPLVLVAGFAAYGFWASSGSKTGEKVTVLIPRGASAGEIADLLASEGIIRVPWLFKFVARVRGVATDLHAGKYELRTRMSYGDVIATLRKGPKVRFARVTIPEGKTVREVAAIIGRKTHITAAKFLAAIKAGVARPKDLPKQSVNYEGYLFPKTYDILEDATARDVVRLLTDQFQTETKALDWSAASRLEVTPYQIVVIASLIEREAKVAKDRPLIAAVIYNRLRRGMRLQIDATVQYAIFQQTGRYKSRLLFEDLEIDSPYNTYRIDGLPPAPIASPGLDSIRAALAPASVDYLYYVLINDKGEHAFASTAAEFERLKRRAKSRS